MGTFVDRNVHRFGVGDPPTGIIHIYRPGSFCPMFVIPDVQPGETFGMITDREAPGIMPFYAISNYGRVWHVYREIFMEPGYDRGGYVIYSLQRSTVGPLNYRAHRLVMLKYRYFEGCEDTDKWEVNHINGNKYMNYVDDPILGDNLEWTTRKYNILHANETGLRKAVKDYTHYTPEQIVQVCELLAQKQYSYNVISLKTDVDYYVVANIKYRNIWTHISCNYDF